MTNEPDLTPVVRSWLRHQAVPLPEDVRQWVMEQLPALPQQPAKGMVVRRPSRIGSMRLAFAGLAAALVIAVGAIGLRLWSGGTTPSVGAGTLPSPSNAASSEGPSLGTDIPAGAESGFIDTPIGRARWVHLTGDESSLPLSAPFAQASMFVALEAGMDDDGNQLDRQRWTSPDGMRWTASPLSIPSKRPTRTS